LEEEAEIPRISLTLKASVPTILLALRNLALDLEDPEKSKENTNRKKREGKE
jgi:hypothetical protein